MEPAPRRRLSLFDASMLVMGGILGVGIFFTPQRAAALAGDANTFLGLWVAGGFLAFAGAVTFAELSATFPRDGGWFVYLREAFGRFPAFLFAWIVLFVVSTGAIAVIADFCVGRLAELWPALARQGEMGQRTLGTLLIVGLTAVCLRGYKSGSRLQDLTMLLKLGTVAVLVIASCVAEPLTPAAAPAEAVADGAGGSVVQAMLSILFAVGGWQLITYIAPQVEDPQRTLPRALTIGVAGVMLVYVAFNAAALHVLGLEGIVAADNFASAWAHAALGDMGGRFIVAAMALSAFGVCAAIVMATPGLYVAMARERLFLASFGRLHSRTGAPVAALLCQCAVALVYFHWRQAGRLADAVVFAEWIFHTLAGLALLRLRATRPDLPRPYRSAAYPLFPLLYTLAAAGVVLGTLIQTDLGITGVGLGVLGVGALVYTPWRRWMDR